MDPCISETLTVTSRWSCTVSTILFWNISIIEKGTQSRPTSASDPGPALCHSPGLAFDISVTLQMGLRVMVVLHTGHPGAGAALWGGHTQFLHLSVASGENGPSSGELQRLLAVQVLLHCFPTNTGRISNSIQCSTELSGFVD